MKVVYYNQTKGRVIQKIKNGGLFVAVFILIAWSFFWLPYFRISEILINDPLVPKKEVEKKLAPLFIKQRGGLGLSLSSFTRFFLPQNNFFLFPSKNAEKIILESGLGVAEVEKKFPNKVSVDFKEVRPKFLYCEENECFYVDKNGAPYETAPFFSDSPIPILEINKNLRLGEKFLEKHIADFLIGFEQEIQKLELKIKTVKIDKDIRLTTSEGWYLILILKENASVSQSKDIAEKLFLLFERTIKDRSMLEYIDMRFPNKAFYKLK